MSYLEKKNNSLIFFIKHNLHSNQFGHTVNAVAATSYLAMLWELNVRNVHYPRSLGFGGSYVHGRDDILSFGWCNRGGGTEGAQGVHRVHVHPHCFGRENKKLSQTFSLFELYVIVHPHLLASYAVPGRGKSSLKNMRNIGGCHHQHHLSTQGRGKVSK